MVVLLVHLKMMPMILIKILIQCLFKFITLLCVDLNLYLYLCHGFVLEIWTNF